MNSIHFWPCFLGFIVQLKLAARFTPIPGTTFVPGHEFRSANRKQNKSTGVYNFFFSGSRTITSISTCTTEIVNYISKKIVAWQPKVTKAQSRDQVGTGATDLDSLIKTCPPAGSPTVPKPDKWNAFYGTISHIHQFHLRTKILC